MAKKYVTVNDLESLSEKAKQRLTEWFDNTYEYDDDPVHVYIPEEKSGKHDGVFKGQWDSEKEFTYPEEYIGKIKNHKGTILPLMDITLMVQFLEDHGQTHLLADSNELWQAVKEILEK